MSTVAALIDRVFRDYLHAGDDQPARVRLSVGVDATATEWEVDLSMLPVDARQVLTGGIVIEAGRELVLVTDVSAANVATVVRGANGTTPAVHAANTLLTISPAFGRQVVFDAVADNVAALYPTLWTVKSEAVDVAQPYTEVPDDVGTILAFRAGGAHPYNADARLIDTFPDSSTGKAAVIEAASGTAGTIVYRGGFGRPDADSTDVSALGVRPEWEKIVVVGAAAQLLSGRDVEAVTQEWLGEQLQAESLPPTTPGRISARLLALYEHYLQEAGRRLRTEDRKRIRRVPVRRTALR